MIQSFTDINAWKLAKQLAVSIYTETENFPKSEIFGLTSQMRRSAISVSSNIAEGFGRFSDKDQEHFYIMASGSLYEIKSQIIIAGELHMIKNEEFLKIIEQIDETHRTLNGLIRAHKKRYAKE